MIAAAVCREFGAPLEIEQLELADPGPRDVLVRMHACALCHSDIAFAAGAWGGQLPAVYGHEAAGVVERTGSGVRAVAAGDRVAVTLARACGRCAACAGGRPLACSDDPWTGRESPLRRADGTPVVHGIKVAGLAEYVLVDESQAIPVPAAMPLESASLLACAVLTGVGAVLRSGALRAGERLVVIGTGGVGLQSVQAGRIGGARSIVAIDPSPERRTAALQVGATAACDPAEAAAAAGGADLCVVATTHPDAYRLALELLRRGGRAVLVGLPATGVTIDIDPTDVAERDLQIIGSKLGWARPHLDIPWLAGLYLDGSLELDTLVTGRYPLERVNDAIADAAKPGAVRNVIAFT